MYGSKMEFGPRTEDLRKRWIALHARRLGFEHPIEKTPVECLAPFPDHWQSFEAFQNDLKASCE